jgi:hypothetical protein
MFCFLVFWESSIFASATIGPIHGLLHSMHGQNPPRFSSLDARTWCFVCATPYMNEKSVNILTAGKEMHVLNAFLGLYLCDQLRSAALSDALAWSSVG